MKRILEISPVGRTLFVLARGRSNFDRFRFATSALDQLGFKYVVHTDSMGIEKAFSAVESDCAGIILDADFLRADHESFLRIFQEQPHRAQIPLMLVRPEGVVDPIETQFPVQAVLDSTYGRQTLAFLIRQIFFPVSKESRIGPRALLRLPVKIDHTQTKSSILKWTFNVSTEGMFVHTHNPFPASSFLDLSIYLPKVKTPLQIREGDGLCEGQEPKITKDEDVVLCTARVQHARPSPRTGLCADCLDPPGMGLLIKGITQQDRMRLGEFIFAALPPVERSRWNLT